MGTSAHAAAWFLPAVVPICLFVAWHDLRKMKILNKANLALLIAYAVLGLIALPFGDYLWRYVHLVVALIVGIVLNAGRILGAGDAKFIAAAAPFVALSDLGLVAILLAACLLIGLGLHRLAAKTPIRRLAPDWKSWTERERFPMGFPLGVTLILYLLLALRAG